MSRRLSRQAGRLQWKPYRADRAPKTEVPPPEGELWIVDADTHEQIEHIDEKQVDSRPKAG